MSPYGRGPNKPTAPRIAELPLGEIQPVAVNRPAHSVVIHPAYEFLVDAALVDQILAQTAYRIIGERRYFATAVSMPKQRFSPRATLYSPPPVDIKGARGSAHAGRRGRIAA